MRQKSEPAGKNEQHVREVHRATRPTKQAGSLLAQQTGASKLRAGPQTICWQSTEIKKISRNLPKNM